jgi:hypothetical protein
MAEITRKRSCELVTGVFLPLTQQHVDELPAREVLAASALRRLPLPFWRQAMETTFRWGSLLGASVIFSP